MFVLRAVCGEYKGRYYVGYERFGVQWSDSLETAEKVSPADAAGLIMAMIDGPKFVIVPEMLPGTPEAECDEFAKIAASGVFQNPINGIPTMIKDVIRRTAADPFYDHPATHKAVSGDFMSVWEWFIKALAANTDNTTVPDSITGI